LMKWYQHTKHAQLRIVTDAYIKPDVLVDHYEHDDIENERYKCPRCGKDEFVVTYHPQWPKAGCRSNDCELKSYMNVLELIESFWSDNEVEVLPEETRARKQVLRCRLEGLCDAMYDSEEASREEQLDSLQGRVSSLETERDEWERVAEALRSENDALQVEYASVSAKLQRRTDREARDAGTITGIVASVFVMLWTGAFAASAARADLSAGWTFAMLLVSLTYGVAVGYAFYREMVRHRREPYYRRVDLRRLLRWAGKAVLCFAGSYVLVRVVTGLDFVDSLAPPGGIERSLFSVLTPVLLALSYQVWASKD
jgi:hypothetical protein